MLTDATPSPPARTDPPGRRHPKARRRGRVVGWIATVLAGLALTSHFLDTSHQVLIVLASGAYVFTAFAVVAAGLHLWRRAWVATVVAALVVVADVVVYAPMFVSQTAPSSPAATVHVLTQNMLFGEADANQIVGHVESGDADVFMAQELTGTAVTKLRAAGLERLLPYSVLDARADYTGTGLWSRYPISDPVRLAARGLEGVTARVALPRGTTVTAVTVHPAAPFPQAPGEWYRDLDRVRGLLTSMPSGPVLVGGDFNATIDHARFRRLLVDGWHDGAEQAGAGLLRTWPTDKGVPALVGIDHVLTRGTVATAVRPVAAPGSDHLGLLATVVVPS